MPARLKDHYAWIHNVILEALQPLSEIRLANCQDCLLAGQAGSITPAPFATRDCFTEPVSYDVLSSGRKIVGGALCHRQNAFLYQGAIQTPIDPNLEMRLQAAFQRALIPS